MYSLTMDYDTFSNEEKIAVAVLATSIEVQVTGSKAMYTLRFPALLSTK